MAKRVTGDELRKWALVGAEQRLAGLAAETAAIRRIFPELRGKARGGAAVVARAAQKIAGRPRRRMSAAGRASLRAALKKRWAAAKKAGKTRLG